MTKKQEQRKKLGPPRRSQRLKITRERRLGYLLSSIYRMELALMGRNHSQSCSQHYDRTVLLSSVRLQEIDKQMSSIASSSSPSGRKKLSLTGSPSGSKKCSLAGSGEGGSKQSSGSCHMCCAERSNITKIAALRVAEIEHELGEEVYHFAWDLCAYPKFAEQVMFQVSMGEELGKKCLPSFLNRKFQQFTRLGDCEFDQLYSNGHL